MPTVRRVGNFEQGDSIMIRDQVIQDIHRAIFYYLTAHTQRELHLDIDREDELLVSLDLLAFTAEHYRVSPLVAAKTVRGWRDKLMPIFDESWVKEFGSLEASWPKDRRPVVEQAFSHLETAARNSPIRFWGDNPEESA